MSKYPILTSEDVLKKLDLSRAQAGGKYFACYSTWLGGIVTDPKFMVIPLDDHMVHRGDGVFEALRGVQGALFDLNAHLDRLMKSAEYIGLKPLLTLAEMREICLATAKASGESDLMLRIFLSRGAGSFSPNPYDPKRSHFYVVATEFVPVKESVYQSGAKAIISEVEAKTVPFAQIKSCNYLPNVLMKKEAVDQQVDFSLAVDRQGRITEGSTENLIFLSDEFELCVPRFDYTLKGTTLLAMLDELSQYPIDQIKSVNFGDFTIDDLKRASEMAVVGTTLEVLPITQLNGAAVGSGAAGPVMVQLRERLRGALFSSQVRRTPFRQ